MAACVSLAAASSVTRTVLTPVAVTLLVGQFFWLTLAKRRRTLPLFDAGTMTVLAVICYNHSFAAVFPVGDGAYGFECSSTL